MITLTKILHGAIYLGSNVRAKVKHVGSGKYRIIEDNGDGKYVGKVVDASDIFHCNL
ncbi:MAG: hypothetical protein WB664_01185 [Nitrososphaeraceae archaeon]